MALLPKTPPVPLPSPPIPAANLDCSTRRSCSLEAREEEEAKTPLDRRDPNPQNRGPPWTSAREPYPQPGPLRRGHALSRPPEMTPRPATSSSAVPRRHGPGLLGACVGLAGGRGILGNDRGRRGGWLRPAGSTHAGAVGGGGCRARASGTWSSRGRRRAPGASRGLSGRPRRRATWTCPPLLPTARRCLAAAPR